MALDVLTECMNVKGIENVINYDLFIYSKMILSMVTNIK